VYLQLEDQALTAVVLEGERVAWQERVPLPEGLCESGQPRAIEALGDLLGDLLVERGYAGARLKAVLPRAATAWRVIEWPDSSWPEHPELVVRQQQQELNLPWSLQDADLLLEPLMGAQPRSLLVAVQRSVLEAWIEVCNQAGVALDAVEALPMCLWRAVRPMLQQGDGVQLHTVSSSLFSFVNLIPERTGGGVAGEGEHADGAVVPNGDSTYVMTKEHAAAFKKVLFPLHIMCAPRAHMM
jgi:Tfp pilus assembly PilM family ATPase